MPGSLTGPTLSSGPCCNGAQCKRHLGLCPVKLHALGQVGGLWKLSFPVCEMRMKPTWLLLPLLTTPSSERPSLAAVSKTAACHSLSFFLDGFLFTYHLQTHHLSFGVLILFCCLSPLSLCLEGLEQCLAHSAQQVSVEC